MGCKALFIGGIKSGKSKNAEEYVLKLSITKPLYLATNEFFDTEMQQRVQQHKLQRKEKFETIEEPLKLYESIKQTNKTVLVECVSMWINNMLYHNYNEKDILQEMDKVCSLQNDIIFVINDVGCSVISENKLTRMFVDINGKVAQLLANRSTNVYNNIAGIQIPLKTS